jgi:hypothetical protein
MSDPSRPQDEEFIAKLRNMNAETEKFVAEQRKLIAEADKFRRDQTAVLISAGAALTLAGAAIFGLVAKLLGH